MELRAFERMYVSFQDRSDIQTAETVQGLDVLVRRFCINKQLSNAIACITLNYIQQMTIFVLMLTNYLLPI